MYTSRTLRGPRDAGAAIILTFALTASVAIAQTTQPASPPSSPPPTTAPAKDLPPAKQVISNAIEAAGGADAIAKINRMRYTLTISAQGQESKLDLRSARPGKVHVAMETPQGSMQMGRVGDVAWQNTGAGYQLVPKAQMGQISQLDLYGLIITLGDRQDTFETVDRTPFNGIDAFKLKLADEPGGTTFGYFDADGGAIVGLDQTQTTPMGPMSLRTTFSETKTMAPLTLFTKASMVAGGAPLATLMFSEVQFNPADDYEITVPPEVQQLVLEREAAATNPTTRPATATTKPAGGGDLENSPMVKQVMTSLQRIEDPGQLRMMVSVIEAQAGLVKTDEEKAQMQFLVEKIRERIAELEDGE